MALADYVALVTDKLRETAALVSGPQKEAAVQEAVKDYSRKVRPRRRVQIITGTGSAHTFALASDFEEGFSSIDSIENPVDRQEPEYLDADETMLYRDSATGVLKLRFISKVPSNGEKAYVAYTTRQVVNDAGVDTVAIGDRESIACKATAILLRQLATYASQVTRATIGAEIVDRLQQVDVYLRLAKELEDSYATTLGIPDELPAASAVADLDVTPEYGGDRFFHSRFRR
jgi:hypothetical protein